MRHGDEKNIQEAQSLRDGKDQKGTSVMMRRNIIVGQKEFLIYMYLAEETSNTS